MHEGLIDHTVLDELRDATGSEFLAELVATFLDEAPAMMAELKDAAAGADVDRFRRAAHSIKSNANTFGATSLAEQARAMELAGLSGDATSADAIDALETELARASMALKGILNG